MALTKKKYIKRMPLVHDFDQFPAIDLDYSAGMLWWPARQENGGSRAQFAA
jgi:hypothetical protein